MNAYMILVVNMQSTLFYLANSQPKQRVNVNFCLHAEIISVYSLLYLSDLNIKCIYIYNYLY